MSGYIFTKRQKYVSVSSNKKEIVAVLKESPGNGSGLKLDPEKSKIVLMKKEAAFETRV